MLGQIDKSARRRSLRLAITNGVLWYSGNALTTGTLVIYLTLDLGAKGTNLSLILAAPALSGVLRLFTPPLIARLGGVQRTCLYTFTLSYVLLCALPGMIVAPNRFSIAGLVFILCVHQTLEYIGSVALWTWLGELVPRRLRGRYFAQRQMWQLAFAIPLLLAGGAFADQWKEIYPTAKREWELLGYAIPFSAGCVLLLASLLPLALMPALHGEVALGRFRCRAIVTPGRSQPFRRLLYFGCWLSMANGLVQTAQNIYPKQVLKLPVLPLESMRISMRIGQIGVNWWAGPFADRYGNRRTLILSQLLLGAAPLFFLLATPTHPWWLAGAWLLWSFYAAQNICLPNMALQLSEADDFAPFVATYFAATGLCYAASTVAGGWLFDLLAERSPFTIAGLAFDHFQLLFVGSWITRTAAVCWLIGVQEDRR